jgi:hypothetical protein
MEEENLVVECNYVGIEDAEVLRFWEDKLLEAAPLYTTYTLHFNIVRNRHAMVVSVL